ncbi:hypothetical protein [Paenibacillus cremeus]|uniref:Uncharacterized protein n=1 Tax=Paenibacillus cremeus TaxID=2163881 RepID=A0A559KCI3_9BACL|nr:hypothetical protein [Paenibacillus cremeus]TVY09842.1 hypothetical protein FPZ49_10740 [Paenibacillus cremeus]
MKLFNVTFKHSFAAGSREINFIVTLSDYELFDEDGLPLDAESRAVEYALDKFFKHDYIFTTGASLEVLSIEEVENKDAGNVINVTINGVKTKEFDGYKMLNIIQEQLSKYGKY